MIEKIILWGVGTHSRNLLKDYFVPIDVIEEVVDSNINLLGTDFFGHQVKSPEILKNDIRIKSKTIVIGTKLYYQEVMEQLKRMGINKDFMFIDDYIVRFPDKKEKTTAGYYENKMIESLIKHIQDAGEIRQNQMKNAVVLADRSEAIKRLPKGGKVAEVGVAYGDFSDIILRNMQPDHFYAIDWFSKNNPYISMWGRQELIESGLTHEEWYRNKYKNEIRNNKMTVCSGFSWDCLSEFEDCFFDFIYIDACHDYESVIKDAEIAVKKIKDGGIIQFNDYTIWDILGGEYYGVVPVVNKLIYETGAEVLYYCLNPLGYCDIAIKMRGNNK